MAALYSNENIPLAVVDELRRLGHDVLTTYEAGKANKAIPDEDVLSFATEQKRCVLTLNRRDFRRLHQQTNGAHAGIIMCTADRDYTGQAKRIHEAIGKAPGGLAGAILSVVKPC